MHRYALAVLVLAAVGLLAACDGKSTGEPTSGIAFVSDRDGNQELYLIQADGAGLIRLTYDDAIDADPAFSPDGRQIAFRSRRDGTSDIFVMPAPGPQAQVDADGLNPRNLIKDAGEDRYDEAMPSWAPDGQTLALITDRFYTTTMLTPHIAGAEIARHQVALMPVTGGADKIELLGAVAGDQRTVAWSPDGRSIAFSSPPGFMLKNISDKPMPIGLSRLDRETGRVYVLVDQEGANIHPAWSHDGRRLAFQATVDGNLEIYVLDLETRAVTNLTQHPADDKQPSWSPDDAQIAFATNRDGNDEIYIMDADGSHPRNVTQNPAGDLWPSWSPVPPATAP